VEEEDATAFVGAGGRKGVGTGRTMDDGARKAAGRRGVEEEEVAVEVC